MLASKTQQRLHLSNWPACMRTESKASDAVGQRATCRVRLTSAARSSIRCSFITRARATASRLPSSFGPRSSGTSRSRQGRRHVVSRPAQSGPRSDSRQTAVEQEQPPSQRPQLEKPQWQLNNAVPKARKAPARSLEDSQQAAGLQQAAVTRAVDGAPQAVAAAAAAQQLPAAEQAMAVTAATGSVLGAIALITGAESAIATLIACGVQSSHLFTGQQHHQAELCLSYSTATLP